MHRHPNKALQLVQLRAIPGEMGYFPTPEGSQLQTGITIARMQVCTLCPMVLLCLH